LAQLDRAAADEHRRRLTPPNHLKEGGGAKVGPPQSEVGLDAQIALAHGNEDRDLQNRDGVEVLQLNPVMMEQSPKELAR
jgi:hypothetical protein